MGYPLRFQPEPNTLFEITIRTIDGRLYLCPSNKMVNDLIVGVFAKAASKYGIKVVALAVLGNHLHGLALSPEGHDKFSLFMQFVDSNLARILNERLHRHGPFWGGRYSGIVVAQTAEMEEERLEYVLGQGVRENLVAKATQWPGVHASRALLGNGVIKGIWVNGTAAGKTKRRRRSVKTNEVNTKVKLKLAPLPSWAKLSPAQRRERVAAILHRIEAEAQIKRQQTGKKPFGAKNIKNQDPLSLPHSPPKRTRAPRCHADHPEYGIFKELYRLFVTVFRQAAEMWRGGDRKAPFPVGSFPPGLPFVKPPPVEAAQPA
jgi:REP element-mobilizing transposase RayT